MADNQPLRFGAKKAEPHACKKRKMVEKVVRVKLDNIDNRSGGPPPSDSWSWRKYGQKPIKGSPFPRGYYKCSTLKGCTAKKQVERCKTDASMLIVTYTSSHNHPITKITKASEESCASISENLPETPELEEELEKKEDVVYESLEQTGPNKLNQTKPSLVPLSGICYMDKTNPYAEEQPLANAVENDIYDELDELPTASCLNELMQSNFFDERILVEPF